MAESENIVVATAEKIFADLADEQTINRDKSGAWKAPLWQALTEAGLPLAWVPEDCGGSGASLAEGLGVVGAAGRFAIAVPLAETMLAGWLLAQAKITSPAGEMTVAPASPKDRITLNADGTLSGRTRGIPFAKAAKHIAVLATGPNGPSIALVDAAAVRIEAGLNLGGDNSDTVTFDKVVPKTIKPAPDGIDQTALMLMGGVARCLQIAGSLESMLDISVRYAERARGVREEDLEIPGGAAQSREARRRIRGRAGRRDLGCRCDRQRDCVRRCGLPGGDRGKDPLRGSRRKGQRHRPSGARRDRLHHRAHPASLFPARAGLARRFRLGKLLGGRTRQARRRTRRRRIMAAGRFALKPETIEIHHDRSPPFRSDPPAARMRSLRKEVRAFLAEEIADGTFDPFKPQRARTSMCRRFRATRRRSAAGSA